MKSGCIDFLDFVDKLASRVIKGDQQILRSNHVTLLLAQIIRIEFVMNTLSSDPRKVVHIHPIVQMFFIHVGQSTPHLHVLLLFYVF